MYYCKLNSKRDEQSFLRHYGKCTCLLAHAWHYYKSCQSDHIRAHLEYKGDLIVKFDMNIGMTLEYPKGILAIFSKENRIGYPY